mmetsp:Transcript_5242/g.12497  ORF Transcript_5242/g.12497 Transcript_5242/m.12497 type:complete len:93 (+) Transcript_5242:1267-1545(+)
MPKTKRRRLSKKRQHRKLPEQTKSCENSKVCRVRCWEKNICQIFIDDNNGSKQLVLTYLKARRQNNCRNISGRCAVTNSAILPQLSSTRGFV